MINNQRLLFWTFIGILESWDKEKQVWRSKKKIKDDHKPNTNIKPKISTIIVSTRIIGTKINHTGFIKRILWSNVSFFPSYYWYWGYEEIDVCIRSMFHFLPRQQLENQLMYHSVNLYNYPIVFQKICFHRHHSPTHRHYSCIDNSNIDTRQKPSGLFLYTSSAITYNTTIPRTWHWMRIAVQLQSNFVWA